MLALASASPSLDPWQPTLFATGAPASVALDGLRRVQLDDQSWIDVVYGAATGADTLFDDLRASLAWQRHRRIMYQTLVDVPRLTADVEVQHAGIPKAISDLADQLSFAYGHCFDRVVANLYRNGDDAVAWHADRIGRVFANPVIAVLSLGAERTFALRPVIGGSTVRLRLAGGDLLVMGGACQHRWQHCVPRRRSAGPRISVTLRHDDPPGAMPYHETRPYQETSSSSV